MKIRDEAGNMLSRQCVGFGAVREGERRLLSLQIELSRALRPGERIIEEIFRPRAICSARA
jgi:hypothetical protein